MRFHFVLRLQPVAQFTTWLTATHFKKLAGALTNKFWRVFDSQANRICAIAKAVTCQEFWIIVITHRRFLLLLLDLSFCFAASRKEHLKKEDSFSANSVCPFSIQLTSSPILPSW